MDIDTISKTPSAITTAINAIQNFAKYLLIPCGIVMFAPNSWLKQFRLLDLKNSTFGIWISILFWISASIVVIDFLNFIANKIKSYYKGKRVRKNFSKIIGLLTDSEINIVYLIYKNDSYNFDLRGNAALTKLKSLGVIYSSSTGNLISGFSYGLQPIAQEYIIEHPEFVSNFAERRRKAIKAEIEKLKKFDNVPRGYEGYQDYQKNNDLEHLEKLLEEYE